MDTPNLYATPTRIKQGWADPAINLAAALTWYRVLEALGFSPLLVDSNGRGGFHLWALFAEPVPTPAVFAFLRWLVRDYREYWLMVAPETFPKQPRIDPDRYGNWLRVPGRHHSKDHWSRVWDGMRWLACDGAVSHILGLCGSPASIIPTEVKTEPPPAPAPAAPARPPRP